MQDERSLRAIAREIREDWSQARSGVYFGAVPYLDAMGSLDTLEDRYGYDSGEEVVLYFLANAGTWRGETARAVKAELNSMLKRQNMRQAQRNREFRGR